MPLDYTSKGGPDENLGTDIEHDGILVKAFPSPLHYADYLEKIPRTCWPKHNSWGDSDPISDVKRCIDGMRNGADKPAQMAEEIIKQLEDEQVFADGLIQPETAIVGGFTVTQLYNQGIPTCMLNYDTSNLKGIGTPLTIYFDAYGSIGLGDELAMKRGVACLAFVMALQRTRPVDLYVITCSSPDSRNCGPIGSLYGSLVKVPTNPLDLKRIGFMMTDYDGYIKYGRWTMMNWSYHRKNGTRQGYYSPIGPFAGKRSGENIKISYKKAFDAGPDDIVLYGTQTTAPRIHDAKAANDPVGWVRQMLKIHRDKQENAELEHELAAEMDRELNSGND